MSHTLAAQVAAAHRDALLRDVAGFIALERGGALVAGDVVPDLTAAPLAAALRADEAAAAVRARGARVLGSGGYGVVIAAELTVRRAIGGDVLACRLPCAVKTLWHIIAGPYNDAAFMREVAISCRLVHPNIVRTYGSVAGPPRCLVMELLTCSLGDLFVPRPDGRLPDPLSYREAIDLCTGVVTGVSVMRTHNIVHGDLRLANVLVDADMTAKVSDLGTARQMAELGGGSVWEPVLGQYCAPERVARAPTVMALPYAWDVYSLSVIVVEVLTGERAEPVRWPTLLPRVQHPPLRAAIVDAHTLNPEARSSADALLAVLRGAAETAEYTGCPPRRRIVRDDGGGLRLV